MAYSTQLGSVLGRKVPDYEEALIRGKLPYLTSYKSAQESKNYQEQSQALQKQALEQQQQNAWESLRMQGEAQDEAKKQAKQSELMGWGNTALTTGLGGIQYSDTIKSALGLGVDTAAPSAAAFAPSMAGNVAAQQSGLSALAAQGTYAGGVPGSAGAAAIPGAGEATSVLSGAGEAAGWGAGATALGYAAPAVTGSIGGSLATKIGGGNSTATRAAKGALGGIASGAATGAALGSMGLPGPGTVAGGAIGGVVGAVTQVIGGGGRVICTKLVEMGLLNPELHKSEATWSLANKRKATVRGYHWWAVPFTRFMDGKPRFCKAVAVVVKPYAKFLAYKAGSPLGKFNLFGMALDLAGSAACWCIGQFVKFDKYGPEWDREDAHREEVDANA